jgi:Helix-turn-helix domain
VSSGSSKFISQMINKQTRVCFPLQATLAERLGVSVRAIGGYISNLRRRGHLGVRDRGRDKSSIYELILQDRNIASGHDAGRPEVTFRSCEKDGKSDVARPEISRRKTGSTVPIEPVSVTNLNNQERGAHKARQPLPLSGGETPTSPPTSISESMLARALERAGWDAARSRVEFDKFRDRCLSGGRKSYDWNAEFSLWIERGVEHKSKQTELQGPVIDQQGNPFGPPPDRSGRTRRRRQSNLDRARAMFGSVQ